MAFGWYSAEQGSVKPLSNAHCFYPCDFATSVFGTKMSEAETNGRKAMTNALNRNAAGVVSGHAALAPFGSVISSLMANHLDDRSFEYETFIGSNRTVCDGLPSLHVRVPTAI
jgi:hypothetical protein